MLRLAIIVLLLANAAMLAFNLGWLDRVLGSPDSGREPGRLARQLHADAVSVLSPQAASAAIAAASAAAAASASAEAAPRCVEAGPFVGADAAAAEKRLAEAGLAPGSWVVERGGQGGVYMIYMGRYADNELMQRKLAELQRRQIAAEPMAGTPELQPGLSLGRFESAPQADAALARLAERRVRTARVIMLRAPTPTVVLRFAAADGALRDRLAALEMPAGIGFERCADSTASGAAAVAGSAASAASAPAAASAAAGTGSAASAPRAASAASR